MFRICDIESRQIIDSLFQQEKNKLPSLTVTPDKLYSHNSANTFRDVHVYDGKSEKINIPIYTTEAKHSCITHLQSLLYNNQARQMLNIILSRQNYDPSNQVDSADLLVWICTHNITPELFYLLEEQLLDNSALGTCLQGSSHRIRQIYYAQQGL